jgi:SMI1/KNR4 family protein SUKH-1
MGDWAQILSDPGYSWAGAPEPANRQKIAGLTNFVGRPLPDDYVSFLLEVGAGTIEYEPYWLMRLWRPTDIPSWAAAYGFGSPDIRGALPIADNGGGEALVFDVRPECSDKLYPIYAVDYVSLDWRDAFPIAESFQSLLLLRRRWFQVA